MAGGVKILQLRMKGADAAARRVVAQQLQGLKRRYDFALIINDDLELACELGADGYHGGCEDAPIPEARGRLAGGRWIGYSAHSLPEALQAERAGADYVAFGAIYPSALKGPGHPVQGVEKLRELVKQLRVPVVAIGGIGRDNIKTVRATGVASVAMISALVQAPSPREEAQYYTGLFA